MKLGLSCLLEEPTVYPEVTFDQIALIEKDLEICMLESTSLERTISLLSKVQTSVVTLGPNNQFVECLGNELNALVGGQDFRYVSKEVALEGLSDTINAGTKMVRDIIVRIIEAIKAFLKKVGEFFNARSVGQKKQIAAAEEAAEEIKTPSTVEVSTAERVLESLETKPPEAIVRKVEAAVAKKESSVTITISDKELLFRMHKGRGLPHRKDIQSLLTVISAMPPRLEFTKHGEMRVDRIFPVMPKIESIYGYRIHDDGTVTKKTPKLEFISVDSSQEYIMEHVGYRSPVELKNDMTMCGICARKLNLCLFEFSQKLEAGGDIPTGGTRAAGIDWEKERIFANLGRELTSVIASALHSLCIITQRYGTVLFEYNSTISRLKK